MAVQASTTDALLQKVLDSMGRLETKLGTMDQRLERVENSVGRLDGLVEGIERKMAKQHHALTRDLGRVYELSARGLIEAEYGRSYARSFLVENLIGLTRIAVPKDDQFEDEDKNQLYNQQDRLNKLVDIAVAHVDEFKLRLEKTIASRNNAKDDKMDKKKLSSPLANVSSSSTTVDEEERDQKLKGLMQSLLKLGKEGNRDHDLALLAKSPLGLACFSCSAVDDDIVDILEIDVRGKVSRASSQSYTVEIGEIKIGGESNKDVEQLMLRLAVISNATHVIVNTAKANVTPPAYRKANKIGGYTVSCIGRLFFEGAGGKATQPDSKGYHFPGNIAPEIHKEHL